MKSLLAAVFFLLALSSYAEALDSSGTRYSIQGTGTKSCGAYLEARRQRGIEEVQFSAWLAGFITAVNYELQDTYDVLGSTDIYGALGWVDNFCQSNPTESFSRASVLLAKSLYPKRARKM
jgi:hypothetical protein